MNGKQLHVEAGPLPPAFICLVGSSGYSGKLCLQRSLSALAGGSVHRDVMNDMVVESSGDLGEISVVILGIDDSRFHYSWYVNEVGIYNCQSKKQGAFPCYHWIRNGESVSIIIQTGTVY